MKQKFLSAGVVLMHREHARCRYLLLRAYSYWDFPKGMVEPGETPQLAACREVREETALDDLDFIWGQAFFETPPYGAGKVARYYLAITHTDSVELKINPQLGRPEHEEFRWLSYRDARVLLSERLVPVLDWAHVLSGC
ncbi:bis(5'-nucleosidyl)-tetraphosphatase [Collimonas sp. OK242]|uniref:NUDIX domain-containing protein n=1 Tax=Collimonas sp. OK242 TaxID=1798195 RepID=UPI000896EEA7|nr:NUDIX domain-containing protein [Collimonas sp. OK242]SDY55524.1 bis(5'-nucleosidyl)-tetraphosphatase [Collimonas sp. OK242]